MHKDCVVSFSVCVAHLGKGIANLNVPYTAALLSAIDAFLESEDMALGDVETERCFHVYFFLKVGVVTTHYFIKVARTTRGLSWR